MQLIRANLNRLVYNIANYKFDKTKVQITIRALANNNLSITIETNNKTEIVEFEHWETNFIFFNELMNNKIRKMQNAN